jgi:hypothetical protein
VSVTQSEAVVLQQSRDYLRALGWFVLRIQQGMGCHKGVSDLVAIKGGRTVWIECKATKGKQSEYQRVFQEAVEDNGGDYWLVHSLDELIEQLSPKGVYVTHYTAEEMDADYVLPKKVER